MISIRSGIVNEICRGYISKNSIKEIIIYSERYEILKEFNKMIEIIPILEEDLNFLNMSIDHSQVKYFKHNKNYIENYLLDNHVKYEGKIIRLNNFKFKDLLAFNKVNINSEFIKFWSKNILDDVGDFSLNQYHLHNELYSDNYDEFIKNLEIYQQRVNKIYNALALVRAMSLYNVPGRIDLEPKKFSTKSKGLRAEAKAIDILKKLGFKIAEVKNISQRINLNVTLCGKPDGYIESSPIKKYNGCYLEIKHKFYKNMNEKELYQLYSYYGITKKPILLINFYKGLMEYRFYDTKELAMNWKKIKKSLVQNCKKLDKLLDVNSIEKFNSLRKKLEKNKVSL